jgi:hypothetical protein
MKAKRRLGPPARMNKMRHSPRRNRRYSQEENPGRQPRRQIVEPATQVERPRSLEGGPFARSFGGTVVSFHLDPRLLPHQHHADATQVQPAPDGALPFCRCKPLEHVGRQIGGSTPGETKRVLHKMPVIPTERSREQLRHPRVLDGPCPSVSESPRRAQYRVIMGASARMIGPLVPAQAWLSFRRSPNAIIGAFSESR